MEFLFLKEELVKDPGIALERARDGAEYLDGLYGDDWDRSINLQTLDIKRPFHCVLGQLICQGRTAYLMSPRNGVDRGFSCGMLLDVVTLFARIPALDRSYAVLTDAWKIVLRERREAGETHRDDRADFVQRESAPTLRAPAIGSTSEIPERTLAT